MATSSATSMATDLINQRWIETYKSLITLSIEGFKFAMIANGGAAVAMLAYLGNVAGKGASTPDMRYAMAAFLAGLVSCGFSMLCAYLTQLKLLNETSSTERPILTHRWLLRFAICFFLTSSVFFGIGSWQAVVTFK